MRDRVGIRLRGATIEGDVVADHGILSSPLVLDRCRIVGAISVDGSTLAVLALRRSVVEGRLSARSLKAGSVDLDGSTFRSGVRMESARVELDLNASRIVAFPPSDSPVSVDLHGAKVGGWAVLDDARLHGTLDVGGARIELGLEISRAHVAGRDENGCSIDLRGMEAGRSIFMVQSRTDGGVLAYNARLGRHLDLSGTRLGHDANGVALDATAIGTGSSIRLHEGFRSTGAIILHGARIDQRLRMRDAIIEGHDAAGYAIDATGARVGGNAELDGSMRTNGAIRLASATIEGELSLRGARLGEPVDQYGNSLAAQGLHVRRSVLLTDGFDAAGAVRLVDASIEGQLSFTNARPFHVLALRGTSCAELADAPASWPPTGQLELRGFRFAGIKSDTRWDERLEWVRRQGFAVWSPEPYEQLASYYSSIGDEDAARRVRIAKNHDEIIHLRTVDERRSRVYRLRRRAYGRLLGYGYQRHRAGWLLLATVVMAGWLFALAQRSGAMVPDVDPHLADEPCGTAYACFDPYVYGADVVLPIVDFGQDTAWQPVETPSSRVPWPYVRWALIAIGWFLASVFVFAIRGLTERR